MNKLFFVALVAITSLTLTSCGTYKSSRDSKQAMTGNLSSSMMGKIGTMLIQDIGQKVLPKTGSMNMLGKLSMATKVKSLITGNGMASTFKDMISNNYGIASDKVDNAYGKFGTLKDVASFIGKNASPSFLSSIK